MIDFDEFVVIKEGFLNKLNTAVDRIIEEKQSMNLDYDFIGKALESMVKNSNVRTNSISVITPIKKEEVLSKTLDFFKSIDPEFYKKAIGIILQQNKNIKMNIYNFHNVKDFELRDENDLIEYLSYGAIQARNGNVLVNIPTRKHLSKEEQKTIDDDRCTLEDLYLVVHEISHLFDFNLDLEKPTSKELIGEEETYEANIAREITGEATSIAFEGLLSEYLLQNTSYSKSIIEQITKKRINASLRNARIVSTRLLLAKEKADKGKITLEFLEKLMKDYNLSVQDVRGMATYTIESPKDTLMHNRYAMGGLIAPTIIKTFKTKGIEPVKRYLQEAKNCDLESALSHIGIQLNDEGINELIKNYGEYIQKHDLSIEER